MRLEHYRKLYEEQVKQLIKSKKYSEDDLIQFLIERMPISEWKTYQKEIEGKSS